MCHVWLITVYCTVICSVYTVYHVMVVLDILPTFNMITRSQILIGGLRWSSELLEGIFHGLVLAALPQGAAVMTGLSGATQPRWAWLITDSSPTGELCGATWHHSTRFSSRLPLGLCWQWVSLEFTLPVNKSPLSPNQWELMDHWKCSIIPICCTCFTQLCLLCFGSVCVCVHRYMNCCHQC